MEVSGFCDICGKLLVQHSCSLCGARVCPVCYDSKGKCCKNCAGGRKAEAGPAEDAGLEEVEDDDEIEDLFK
ncbi:MAG: hypothetical protein V1909_03670 [Candidatus Micrarchaeota archaeon]